MQKRVGISDSLTRGINLNDNFYSDISDDDLSQPSEPNSKFNLRFLKYLIILVFPFGAMMTHALLDLNEFSIVDDTNAASESWNNV